MHSGRVSGLRWRLADAVRLMGFVSIHIEEILVKSGEFDEIG